MKKLVKLLFLFGIFSLFSSVFAVNYFFFYGEGCPHCFDAMDYLEKNGYEDLYGIEKKEIYFNEANRDIFLGFTDVLKLDRVGVPFLVVQNGSNLDYEMGDVDIINYFKNIAEESIAEESIVEESIVEESIVEESIVEESIVEESIVEESIVEESIVEESIAEESIVEESIVEENIVEESIVEENIVEESIVEENIVEFNDDLLLNKEDNKEGKYDNLRFLLVLVPAALSDSINPCAFAVIILLLTSILTRYKRKRKVLLAGSLFTLAIFFSYLFMGMGLYSALASSKYTFLLKLCVGILGIIIGLANLKDYFWYGKGFIMEVPLSWRPKMKAIIAKTKSPIGAFLVGIVVSLFLLPCTSGPYITILGFLSSESHKITNLGYFYLVIYNLLFVLPMLLITILVSLGVKKVENLEKNRSKYLKTIHLFVGLLMLGLGFYLLNDLFAWIVF